MVQKVVAMTDKQPEALRLADALEDFWGQYDGPQEPHELNAAAELRRLYGLTQRQDALVLDAERYRWLRQYNTAKYPQVTEAFYLGDRNLDAAIDAAMKGTP